MVELVVTEERRFNVTDAPSLDRRNTERHPDGSPVSRDDNLVWTRPDQNHSKLAPESCGDPYLTRGYITGYRTGTY